MVDLMTSLSSLYRRRTVSIWLLALTALMLVTCGCTQPASQQQTKAAAPITAVQIDSTHILITYPGSTETSNLLELETTITDSAGKIQTKSIGDHQSTTPLKFGATQTLTGTFDGTDHILITGYFMDGSHRTMLDTTL
jgi:hypothetical protein